MRLSRYSYGGVSIEGIPEAKYRSLTPDEIKGLKDITGLLNEEKENKPENFVFLYFLAL